MRTAARFGQPPTAPWLLDAARWDRRAWLLAEALEMYEGSLCSGCGQSTFQTLDARNTGEWEITEATCVACEEVEIKGSHDKPGPGVKRFLTNHIGETEGDRG